MMLKKNIGLLITKDKKVLRNYLIPRHTMNESVTDGSPRVYEKYKSLFEEG